MTRTLNIVSGNDRHIAVQSLGINATLFTLYNLRVFKFYLKIHMDRNGM